MALRAIDELAKEALEKLTHTVVAVVFDFDGTLTNNCELIGFPDGSIVKSRSHSDGQGISLLRDIGLRVAIVTNEQAGSAYAAEYLVRKWNKLPSAQPNAAKPWHPVELFTGVGGAKKLSAVTQWLRPLGLTMEQCAVMGDDLVDVPLLAAAAFRAAPCTAEEVIKKMAHFVSERPAGAGAVRDFANMIVRVRGFDPTKLQTS